MTINYINQPFPPEPFKQELEVVEYYRNLYEGNHEEIFPRAKQLYDSDKMQKWESRKQPRRYYRYGYGEKRNALYHYIVVNFSSVVAELPADLINRALGNISADSENTPELEYIEQVANNSKIQRTIWPAVVQHQVDGGLAYRIRWSKEKGAWFEFKPIDLYFEHEDEMGADIAWIEERGDDKYLRVERQRLENGLTVQQLVFSFEGDNVKEEINTKEYASKYEITIPDDLVLEDVNELMCGYLANDETLLQPRGRSALRNISEIQEEINWTVTRDSIVFEKHGKPKLAIPRKLWDTVAQTNQTNYGSRFVRNADLEVVSYDENNGAVPQYITWEAQTEQAFEHVKRLIQYMLSISKTSPQAIGFDTEGGQRSARAILYEWISTVIKTEAIQDKLDSTLKDAFRKCLILHNAMGGQEIEEVNPVIEWRDMLPKAEAEKDEDEASKYEKGVQSLETTIRNINPKWSEDAIKVEVDKINEEKSVNSLNPQFTQPPRVNIGDN